MVENTSKNETLKVLESVARTDGLLASALLTRVLVHEIGNGLNPMGLQVELLRRRCADDARALEVIEGLRETVRGLGELLDEMRAYAHEVAAPGEDDHERLDQIARLTAALRGD